VREARAVDTDLVILASDDTDLEPSLDEALRRSRLLHVAGYPVAGKFGRAGGGVVPREA
jgi:hypothetical protein